MMPDDDDQTPVLPSETGIRRDLEYMTARWGELPCPAVFEFRAFGEGRQERTAKFSPEWIDDAIDWADKITATGMNVYSTRNPIAHDCRGSASDSDIIAAFFLWADCDDPVAAGNIHRFTGPAYSAAVITGRVPSTRVHTYWALKEPCFDLSAWRDMQMRIAAHFRSDKTVVNPSRIMRVGGTVAYPAKHKRERGYITELTTIRTAYDEPRLPVTLDQMGRVFLPVSATAPAGSGGLAIDTGPQPLDRERTRIHALEGAEWHNSVVRLVASYVSKGLSDAEIHGLTAPLTLAGYTADQTAAEVQTAIDGARRKGWTPTTQAEYEPNFDHAPAPTENDPDPAVTPWRVQTAADFIKDFVAPEYLIDGVVQRGRLYTLTAPTGSGKTAIMLYVSLCIAQGVPVCDLETEQGDVLYLAGENPDDVRGRIIATLDQYGVNPDITRLHFISGTFSIRRDMATLQARLSELPNCVLVVVDTLAAYFDGADGNSNTDMLDFARVLRKIGDVPSNPAIIVPAHPVKNAPKTNLTPMGGSALLNEVDGNLCLWKRDAAVEMHWQGKHRGAEFDPVNFEIRGVLSEKVKDSKGRTMPTVMATPLLEVRAMEIARENMTFTEKLLLNVSAYPGQSVLDRCVVIGMINGAGKAKKSSMHKLLKSLRDQRLIQQLLSNWELTAKGERAVNVIKNEGFLPEDLT